MVQLLDPPGEHAGEQDRLRDGIIVAANHDRADIDTGALVAILPREQHCGRQVRLRDVAGNERVRPLFLEGVDARISRDAVVRADHGGVDFRAKIEHLPRSSPRYYLIGGDRTWPAGPTQARRTERDNLATGRQSALHRNSRTN